MKIWQTGLFASLFFPLASLAPAFAAEPAKFSIPSNSCAAVAGPVGRAFNPANTVDGTTLKDASDVKSLRSKAKDGRTLFIKGGDLSGRKFGNDNFSNICFIGTKFAGTRWSKSRAQGIGFIDADLTGATFDRVVMDYALFRNTVLARVDATGAQLAYGQLDGGWEPSMAGLKLDNARMVGFRFVCGSTSTDGCPFDRKQLSLRGTNLAGASIASFSIWDAQLDDVRLDNTEIGLDQITVFSLANISGPVIIKAEKRSITLDAEAFRAAAGAIEVNRAADTECNNPDSALSQVFCQAGQGTLRAYRDDVNRLYESTLAPSAASTTGGAINVTAPSRVHDRYLKALKRCTLKEEDGAVSCLKLTMSKRRAVLVAQLIKAKPLEQEARALYVSVQTPLVHAVSRNPRLAGLAPLIVDSSSRVLLAYRDDDEKLVARGYAPSAEGQSCSASFAPPGKRAPKGSASFAAWYSGAEFTIGASGKPKKKRKPKKVKGQMVAEAAPAAPAGCTGIIQSGPLVRVPISEDDFDKLWVARAAKS